MGRMLRYIGLAILAGTAWLLIADLGGWIPDGVADRWTTRLLVLGAGLVAVGLLLRLAAPVRREIRRGRCSRCGAPIERGQTLCRDHLKQTLDEIRDRTRASLLEKTGHGSTGC